jgi:hypothetical protein
VNYGFVYIMANRGMPGIYKLGFTDRSPNRRAEELSNSSGVPCPFQVVCYVEVSNARSVEQELHAALDKYRVSPGREFFKCDLLILADLLFGEEDIVSRVDHELEQFLYSESALYRTRLETGVLQIGNAFLSIR